MDGIPDLRGMSGFRRVSIEDDEPTFHDAWEALAFGLNILSITALRAYNVDYNVDESRHSIERMGPAHSLNTLYYERTLLGVVTLLVEKEIVSHARLEELAGGAFPLAQSAAFFSSAKGTGHRGSERLWNLARREWRGFSIRAFPTRLDSLTRATNGEAKPGTRSILGPWRVASFAFLRICCWPRMRSTLRFRFCVCWSKARCSPRRTTRLRPSS